MLYLTSSKDKGDEDIDNKKVDFTNYDIVRNLILNKHNLLFLSRNQTESIFLSNTIQEYDYEFREYVEHIYKKLDGYISICVTDIVNLEILNLLFGGASIQEISDELNIVKQSIFNRLRRMIKKINAYAERS